MTTSVSQWNASEVLNIDPHSGGFTCVGHAKTQGRRCRNPIAKENRGEAARILRTISEQSVQSANFDSSLESLAVRLLCRRWHAHDRSQVISKVDQWKNEIETFRSAENARESRNPTMETSSTNPTPCLAETLESLRREIVNLNDRYASALQLATPARVASSSSPQSIRRVDSGLVSPLTRRSTRSSNHDSTTTSPRTSVETEVARPAPAQDTPEEGEAPSPVRRTSTAQTRSSATDSVLNSPAAEGDALPEVPLAEQSGSSPSPRPVSQQPIAGDCSICCETMTEGNDISWCRGQCGQNFHADCVEIWLATQEGDNRLTTCPYW